MKYKEMVIDLQMPASLNFAVNRNINHAFHRLTWPWCSKNETHLYASLAYSVAQPHIFATPDCLQVHIHVFIRVQFTVPFMVPVLVEAGQD